MCVECKYKQIFEIYNMERKKMGMALATPS